MPYKRETIRYLLRARSHPALDLNIDNTIPNMVKLMIEVIKLRIKNATRSGLPAVVSRNLGIDFG
ncbi:MAG: hypothetical protein ACFE9L_21465 [Candidatus Hodarchaeota archaeon]